LNFFDLFWKNTQIANFMKIHAVVVEFVHEDRVTGRHDEANSQFSQFCKAVPLQAWSGPDSSRKLRFPDFLTTAQYGGKVVSLTHRSPLPPGNTPGTHFANVPKNEK
jgi:hypothetical protein